MAAPNPRLAPINRAVFPSNAPGFRLRPATVLLLLEDRAIAVISPRAKAREPLDIENCDCASPKQLS